MPQVNEISWLNSSFYLFSTLFLMFFSLSYLFYSSPVKRKVILNFSVFSYLI